jgi:hypothetical protein
MGPIMDEEIVGRMILCALVALVVLAFVMLL